MASRLRPRCGREWNAIAVRPLRTIRHRSSAISRSASRRRCDPHHAAAIAGQRHEHAWPLRGMKFRRDIPMRPRMADVEGQRGLIEVAAPDLDAGGFAAKRLPAIGADHKARCQRSALPGANGDRNRLRADRVRVIVDPDQVRKFGRALLPTPPSERDFRCCSRTASRPISSDENLTSGARIRRPVSSTSRIVCSAAALSLQRGQTSSCCRKSTEPPNSAVVRLSA